MSKTIELLAPAKNLECGMAAIDHGADAVYIGAGRFGARAAACNTIDDIRTLCSYAHMFMAKVYVTVNTIIYDSELVAAKELITQLYEAGADAILVQDMALADMIVSDAGMPPIPLHASTQTDNRTPEKVKWLASQGFSRVVLARELSADEIRRIHEEVPGVELEVFVHGALCVSYSGQCYASQYCFGRSANRGECAQFCRLKFDLEDVQGNIIERGRHLLSLKDLCLIDRLENLLDSGVSSLKIEGRLKDINYVKNVTAAYSQRLNEIIAKSGGQYRRASLGKCNYTFKPNLNKTFNRGFTHYFADGRRHDMSSPLTPKAIGEYVGKVKTVGRDSLTIAGTASFTNGDGLCFFTDGGELQGFRVNRAEGNTIYPQKMPRERLRGKAVYRNSDRNFEKQLTGHSAERKISITMQLTENGDKLILTATSGNKIVTATANAGQQPAMKPQADNIKRQLTRLGGTPFDATSVSMPEGEPRGFIPSSTLAAIRRLAVDKLAGAIKLEIEHQRKACAPYRLEKPDGVNAYPAAQTYLYNVANSRAYNFYRRQGITPTSAPELTMPQGALLMQCRYCIRHAMGMCSREGGHAPGKMRLKLADGRRFELQFDCQKCQMNVIAEKPSGATDATAKAPQ